jgi:hemin uptake protein HemP
MEFQSSCSARRQGNTAMNDASNESNRARSPSAPPGLPRIPLADILKGQREAVIEHEGQDYRLRLTASGKLILTK